MDKRTDMSLVLSLQVIAGRVRLGMKAALPDQHFSLDEAQEILDKLAREISAGRLIQVTLQQKEKE